MPEENLNTITEGIPTSLSSSIEHLVVDSRKVIFPKTSLFFALHGVRKDGHEYIKEAYEKGFAIL